MVDNFRQIISTVTDAAPMLENDAPEEDFAESDQTDICEGFREVRGEQTSSARTCSY